MAEFKCTQSNVITRGGFVPPSPSCPHTEQNGFLASMLCVNIAACLFLFAVASCCFVNASSSSLASASAYMAIVKIKSRLHSGTENIIRLVSKILRIYTTSRTRINVARQMLISSCFEFCISTSAWILPLEYSILTEAWNITDTNLLNRIMRRHTCRL